MGIKAVIMGKISSSGSNLTERLEDLMTSNIFQNLSYLSYEVGLKLLIDAAIDKTGASLLKIQHGPVKEVEFEFWPRLGNSEPDVLIHLQHYDGSKSHILIEAKLHSGLSGEYQLDREWTGLKQHYSNGDCFLIYLTKDPIIPSYISSKNIPELYWISYQTIHKVLQPFTDESAVLNDVVSLLEHFRFNPFSKWTIPEQLFTSYESAFEDYYSWTPLHNV